MSDVIYMSFTNMHGETRLDANLGWKEVDAVSKLKPGVIEYGGETRHVANVDFGAKRTANASSDVWVRIVCQTADPLTDEQRIAITHAAYLGGVNAGLIQPTGQ